MIIVSHHSCFSFLALLFKAILLFIYFLFIAVVGSKYMIPRYKLYVIVYVSDMIEKQNAKKNKERKISLSDELSLLTHKSSFNNGIAWQETRLTNQ